MNVHYYRGLCDSYCCCYYYYYYHYYQVITYCASVENILTRLFFELGQQSYPIET